MSDEFGRQKGGKRVESQIADAAHNRCCLNSSSRTWTRFSRIGLRGGARHRVPCRWTRIRAAKAGADVLPRSIDRRTPTGFSCRWMCDRGIEGGQSTRGCVFRCSSIAPKGLRSRYSIAHEFRGDANNHSSSRSRAQLLPPNSGLNASSRLPAFQIYFPER